MVRDLRYPWETLLLIDEANERCFRLQERLKLGKTPPGEAIAAWLEIRDLVDRHMQALAPEEAALQSPSERALSIIFRGLRQVLLLGDFSPSQKDRLEMLLSQARREHLGAEEAAA